MNKITMKGTIKIVTLAGSSILAVNSVLSLLRATSPKGVVMPLVSLAVSLSAFAYATQSTPAVISAK